MMEAITGGKGTDPKRQTPGTKEILTGTESRTD
jgi:hypothetical protein